MNYSQKQAEETLIQHAIVTALIDQANERGSLVWRIVASPDWRKEFSASPLDGIGHGANEQ